MNLSRRSISSTRRARRLRSLAALTLAGVLTSFTLPSVAHAQKLSPARAPAAPPGTAPPVVSPAPQNSPASASAPLSTPTPQNEPPIPIPPPPDVNDPMLAPVAEPAKKVASWEQAVQLLKSRSTSLQTSYDEITRAEAVAREQLADVLPQINGQVQGTHQLLTRTTEVNITNSALINPATNMPYSIMQSSTQPQPNIATGGIGLTWGLLNAAQWQQYGTARAQVDVTKLAYKDVMRTIAQSAASALVSVVTAERVAELNRVSLRNSLELLDLTQRKTNLGSGTGLDVIRAQQTVETARATLVTGDETLRQDRESLGLALGIPEQIGVEKTLNLNGLEQSAHDTCKPARSLDERADIASAKEAVHVADRGIDNVWLQFLPSASLNSTASTSSQQGSPYPPIQWNIQAVLTVPIWDGGTRYGLLHNAQAIADEARQTLEIDRRVAIVQITQAQRSVAVAEKSREVAANARQLAAENDRLTRVGYVEGKYTSNDLVLSTDALRQAEIQLALQEFGVVQAKVAAILALATCNY